MKFNFKILPGIFIILLLTISFQIVAQVHIEGKPAALLFKLQEPKVINLKVQDSVFENGWSKNELPLKAGYSVKISENVYKNSGDWVKINDQKFVWRTSFFAEGVKSMNIYFEDFNLSNNDKLFVYSKDINRFLGAFSKKNNGKYFATGMVNGNLITVEYITDRIKTLPFVIKEVGLIFHPDGKDFGGAGDCEVPVNCSEGDDWQKQKSGVTRILVKQGSGLYWCTGSLINNTAVDGKPYILTANHCGRSSSAADYSEWVFDFNFESEDCSRPATAPVPITFTGASLIANGTTPAKDVSSDFKLVLLDDSIPAAYHLFFNGWDRTGETPDYGVVIHHPQGDIKFISTYDEAVSTFYYGAENPDAPFWKVTWIETEHGHGVTEGGSSGSPLFNEKGLITGTLTGGNASCTDVNSPDYFGKFFSHWDKNGTSPEEQLKPWLDPENTGAKTLKGFYKNQEILSAGFYSDVNKVNVGSYVKFYDNSEGTIVKYHWKFEGGDPEISDEKNPPLVNYKNPGKYSVELIVESQYDVDSVIKENFIEVIGSVYPNPFVKSVNDKVHILIGDTPQENIDLNVYDISGKYEGNINFEYKNNEVVFYPGFLSAGVYIVYVTINNMETPYKLVVLNKLEN